MLTSRCCSLRSRSLSANILSCCSNLERTGPPGPGLLALLPFLLPPYSLPRSLPWSMLLLLCLILSPSELWELAGLVGVEECRGPPPPPFLPETFAGGAGRILRGTFG